MQIKRVVIGELETNCYLLLANDEIIVIDPGDGEVEKIFQAINDWELKNKMQLSVTKIINTHYHFDHTVNNQALKQKTGAEIFIHQAEKDFIDFTADHFLQDGDKINVGQENLKVMHTPGHSAGSICLLGEKFIFTGDTLFEGAYGRVDFSGGSATEMRNSLTKLNLLLKPGIIIYPGHGESFKFNFS